MPSSAPSVSSGPSVSAAPTNTPTTETDLGVGNCLDGSGHEFTKALIVLENFNYTDKAISKTLCTSVCSEHTAPPYVGFETLAVPLNSTFSEVWCGCLFNAPWFVPDFDGFDYNLNWTDSYYTFWASGKGCGNIVTTDKAVFQKQQCYRVSSNPIT
eukprot:scaffold369681_cov248-Cyclotella_meneghiniana.AAC.1